MLRISDLDRPQVLHELISKGTVDRNDVTEDVYESWKAMESTVGKLALENAFNEYLTGQCSPRTSTLVKSILETKSKEEKYESVKMEKLPNYELRVNSHESTNPLLLGVDTVAQSAGYFDINEEDKHLFYWFFESRNDPKNDPIILWLNGGPGCSSMTGLFFELGPSSINGTSLTPIYNPFSWNNNASVIFLEQPVGVGYSYASSSSVTSSKVAAQDVYAFLELFFTKFNFYSKNNFVIAGESYAGHYIPSIASEILSHPDRSFELTSLMIGNGLTDSLIQYAWYGPMACNATLSGYKQLISDEECEKIDTMYGRCKRLIQACYNSQTALTCLPANLYCERIMGPFEATGLNYYDIRTTCDAGTDLCYTALDYVDQYLNLPEVMLTLGAEVDKYTGCDDTVFRNFIFSGDEPKPFQQFIAEVLDANLPVLIYAGDKDYICNWLGNLAWTEALEWKDSLSYQEADFKPWISNIDGDSAGLVKTNGQFTFARVFEAGHMVPYDQPSNALDMVNRWIAGDYSFA
ncbi:hypothetical protein CANARDRAFT_192635 [[Candida] arabinofermentans NRRL YB-2248]|uniref:Carboxypeptidase n=1 Tax=[Candida] arabinofermentans NRRL YB-2248 TaxID=983967 RepID=A0A1E4T8T0_9ASCO|nr:hypothetical protein CANARDRAFT_192635 [[Candida] arabinofermentans NRRL YB-2248]